MRKLGISLGVIIALVVLALLIIPAVVDINQYHGKIEAELQKQLNRPVSLGNMHLRLLPPSVRVDSFSVGEDPAFGNGKFANAQQLYVSVKLLPLLHKDVEVSSLELRRPDIELIRNAQGTWNFSTIGKQQAAQQPAPQPAPQQPTTQQPAQPSTAQPSGPGKQFALDNLSITDGSVAVTDASRHQPRQVYDHIDIALKNYAPDRPFTVNAAAHLPGKGNQTVQLAGRAGPINNSDMIQTPFSGTLKLNDVQLSGVKKYLNSPQLENTDAIISGNTDINNDKGKVSSRGTLNLTDAVIRGVTIGYPISADYRVIDDLANDLITIDKGDIKLGSTPVSVSGTLNSKSTPAQIDARLKASDVSIAEAARLASAFGVAFSPNMKVVGRVNADVQAKGPANQPAMNGTVSARDLVMSGSDVPEPVKVQAIELNLTPQQIRSNPFTATSGSTNLGVQFTLANYTTPAPAVDATVHTANAQIAELLSIAKAYGVSAAEGTSGSGTLNLDVHAAGPLKNPNAMTFNGSGAISNASLKPPSLTQPLNVKNANLQFTSNSAVLTNLAASLGSTNASGNVTVRNFAAPDLQFTLNADKVNITELQQITSGSNQPQQKRASLDWSLVPAADAQTRPAHKNAAPPHTAAAAPAPSILAKMTGKGNVSIGSLVNDQLVINNLRSGVTLSKGVVTLAPITALLYNGQETGQITANLLTTPMVVNVASKLNGVNANDLLSSVSSVKNTIYGLLAASTDLRFSAASSNDIARTLNGTMGVNLSNGKIAKIDILNQLAAIGKFAGVRKSSVAMTNVAKLTGNFNIVNGVAQTNNLQAVIDGGTLAAAGTVDLGSQALNMHLTAVLDKNVTQQVGGSSIGGLMQTALQNNRGELVMPVLLTGTFDSPHFEPDLQKIAEMRVNNILPSLSNPAGGAGGVLGSLLKGGSNGQGGQQGGLSGVLGAIGGQQKPAQPQQQQGNQAQQQQQQQGNAIGDLVNSVLGGKKKKPQQQQSPPQ